MGVAYCGFVTLIADGLLLIPLVASSGEATISRPDQYCECSGIRLCECSGRCTDAGNEMIGKLLKMQMLEDDDELAYMPAETEEAMKREADGRPGWMRILSSDLLEWSKMLPKVCRAAVH